LQGVNFKHLPEDFNYKPFTVLSCARVRFTFDDDIYPCPVFQHIQNWFLATDFLLIFRKFI